MTLAKRPNLALVGSEAVLIDLQFDEIVSKGIPQVTANAVVVEKVFKAWHLEIPLFYVGQTECYIGP